MPVPINSAVPGRKRTAPQTRRQEQQLRVPLGYVVVTRAVAQQLMCHEEGRSFVMSCLYRHAYGDWGALSAEDSEANDLALTTGGRILSSYPIPDQVRWSAGNGGTGATGAAMSPGNGSGTDPGSRGAVGDERLWIITEAEDASGVRSQTTVLFPSDY